MEIKTYSPSVQVDPAIDLGVVAPGLPGIVSLREFVAAWEFPLMRVAKDLNPEASRRPPRTRCAAIGSLWRGC